MFCWTRCPHCFCTILFWSSCTGISVLLVLQCKSWYLADVHHSITFSLLPTWCTNFLFIHINYIKLNSSTCFERNPLIIRRSTTQIVHMSFLSGCTRRSLAESDDTRVCICTICVVDLLMMIGLRSKHVEEFNFI